MATATKKSPRGMQVARASGAVPDTTALAFLIHEDNGGEYRWTILGSTGETLSQSVSYATYDDAELAARVVHDSAGAARLEPRPASDHPVDLTARQESTTQRDDSDPERWLDESGSFSSQAVAKWPVLG